MQFRVLGVSDSFMVLGLVLVTVPEMGSSCRDPYSTSIFRLWKPHAVLIWARNPES